MKIRDKYTKEEFKKKLEKVAHNFCVEYDFEIKLKQDNCCEDPYYYELTIFRGALKDIFKRKLILSMDEEHLAIDCDGENEVDDEIYLFLAYADEADKQLYRNADEIKGLNYQIKKLKQENKALKNKLAELNGQKDTAYSERNKLVAHLSKIYYAELARHDETDIHWEDDWRNIVSMHAPKGRQMSWHIHDSEIEMFSHLNFDGGYLWDGHSTEEKYKRLSEISDGRLFCSKCESEIMRAKHRKMFPRYE